MRRLSVWAILLALIPVSANATWFEARTDHFVLTIDDTPENARAFAEKLERFDAALRRLYAVQDNPDQHLRPLAVYAFEDGLFHKTCDCEGVLGYYQARVRQSVIFTAHMPEIDKKMKIGGWSSQSVLLHEYGHHFTFSNFPIAYPKWFSEGFAEFNATAEFAPDGSVLIGYPANYRAEAIHDRSVSVWDLFDADSGDIPWGYLDGFYGKGWLLTHYLMLSHNREGQLAKYLDLINHGQSGRDAAKLAFGDLNALNTELFDYSKHGLAPRLRIPPSSQPLNVSMRQLSPGEVAMLPTYAAVRSGATKDAGRRLATDAEAVAKRYPDDPTVQSEWAEVEYRTDRSAIALQAADAALRIKPQIVDALVIKGMVAADVLRKAGSKDTAAWDAARGWFLNANHADPNAVMPLYEYYETFVSQGVTPPDSAVKALMRAQVLAPESSILRAALARQMLLNGDSKAARSLLAPLAYSPHATDAKDVPLQVMKLIDAGKTEEATQLLSDKIKDDAAKAN
jgi:tetratricopeptide (TPR) repeat protein